MAKRHALHPPAHAILLGKINELSLSDRAGVPANWGDLSIPGRLNRMQFSCDPIDQDTDGLGAVGPNDRAGQRPEPAVMGSAQLPAIRCGLAETFSTTCAL